MSHRSPHRLARLATPRASLAPSARWFGCLFLALACATGPRHTSIDFGSPWHMVVGDSERAVGTVTEGSPDCSDYKYNSFDRPGSFTWSTSDPMVVTVDSLGWLTARAPGTATVRVTAEGRSDTVTVVVNDAPASPRGAR